MEELEWKEDARYVQLVAAHSKYTSVKHIYSTWYEEVSRKITMSALPTNVQHMWKDLQRMINDTEAWEQEVECEHIMTYIQNQRERGHMLRMEYVRGKDEKYRWKGYR